MTDPAPDNEINDSAMIIITDTNVLYGDPLLELPQIRLILAAEQIVNIRLLIPAIVIDELRSLLKKELNRLHRDAITARRRIAILSGVPVNTIRLQMTIRRRRQILKRFDEKIQLFNKEGRILKYPRPSTRELARRSIKAMPPFNEHDRGLRDTLIWLSIRDVLMEDNHQKAKVVLLVTSDKLFWNASRTGLNEYLLKELDEECIDRRSVAVLSKVQDVIDDYIANRLSPLELVAVAMEADSIKDFTGDSDAIQSIANDWALRHLHRLEEEIENICGYSVIDFDLVEDVAFGQITRTFDIGSGEVVVESEWSCNIYVVGHDGSAAGGLGEELPVAADFAVSSIVRVESERLSVRHHEVTGMQVTGRVER